MTNVNDLTGTTQGDIDQSIEALEAKLTELTQSNEKRLQDVNTKFKKG